MICTPFSGKEPIRYFPPVLAPADKFIRHHLGNVAITSEKRPPVGKFGKGERPEVICPQILQTVTPLGGMNRTVFQLMVNFGTRNSLALETIYEWLVWPRSAYAAQTHSLKKWKHQAMLNGLHLTFRTIIHASVDIIDILNKRSKEAVSSSP